MKLTYRADIDGIRAIAVLAIIFYHADIKFFTGGFVGVDIFFVISGYLITTIILREISENKFSLVQFYERRIRRIFPALFTVLAATLLVSGIFFDANEFQEFGKSLAASILFVSNILFWTQSGYFDAPSSLKPLLHIWSLAVEEQFYIFIPLLLLFLTRYLQPKLTLTLLGITLASFALNLYNLNHDSSGAFYLAHMRAWELLIGSLLAIKVMPKITNLYIHNLLGLLGLAMLATPIFLYTNATPFPGIAAVIPTLGTALIIYSGVENKTFTRHILSFEPLVFIGQISYSLYLWHWPMIVFAKYYTIIELKSLEIAIVLLAIFILSVLSWQFIEKPIREKIFFKDHRIFTYAGIVMILSITVGVIIYLKQGFPGRFSSRQADIVDTEIEKKWRKCDLDINNLPAQLELCAIGEETNTPSFLLWGDSHAGVLAPSVQISASQAGKTGLIAYTLGCAPLLGVDVQGRLTCNDLNTLIINYIQENPNLETIILAARWAFFSQGTYYKNEEGTNIILVNIWADTIETDNANLFKVGFNQTIDTLLKMGRKVVIVTQIPEIGYDVPSAFSIAQRTGRDINKVISPSLNEYRDRNAIVIAVVEEAVKNDDVQIVEPWKALCNEINCLVMIEGQPLYKDDDHLSIFGTEYISHIFDPIFKNLQSK